MDDIKLLVDNFRIIANKGYIKSSAKGNGSIGLTFEQELGKKSDSIYFPDYYGTEIKCTSRFSRYPINLFSIAFDGPTYPEINRIIDKYGWYDNEFKDKKVLFSNLYYKRKKIVNEKQYFKLEFSNDMEKLYLNVYDLNKKLIEQKSFVYTLSIYNHLFLKLKRLAIVKASIKRENNEEYYRYYSINIYELISFEKFLELLKNDEINVSLIARISRSGEKKGLYRNKNLIFSIDKDKLEKLFRQIYSYSNDSNIIYNQY